MLSLFLIALVNLSSAKDISKEFRDKAREIIPVSEANRLRERLREKTMEKLSGLKNHFYLWII